LRNEYDNPVSFDIHPGEKMNRYRSLFVAVGLGLLLAGCAHTGDAPAFRDFGVRTESVAYASVQVVGDDTIVVSQEPIFVKQEMEASDRDNKIFWSLPPGGTYFFSNTNQNPGIKFDRPMPNTRCDYYNNDKYTYVCMYKRANRDKYPYTIRVTKNGTDILKSDPTVLNN
jgi:hypothetical protein